MTSVIIADDHYLVRLGLKVLITSLEDFQVVKEAASGKEVLEYIDDAEYFILDLEMPELSGVETLKIIKEQYPEKKVILLTNSMYIPTLVQAKKLKPDGFLFKDSMHQEIITCLEEIKRGNYYYGENCNAFFNLHKEEVIFVENLFRNLDDLTKSEMRVLQKISENLSTPEIAEALFNSPKTIDNHRTNIVKKLDISGYNSLQIIAIKYKRLIDSLFEKSN